MVVFCYITHRFSNLTFLDSATNMAFRSWFSMPVVKADDDEELVDPQAALRV